MIQKRLVLPLVNNTINLCLRETNTVQVGAEETMVATIAVETRNAEIIHTGAIPEATIRKKSIFEQTVTTAETTVLFHSNQTDESRFCVATASVETEGTMNDHLSHTIAMTVSRLTDHQSVANGNHDQILVQHLKKRLHRSIKN